MRADRIIAHRGCSLLRPENTRSAFIHTQELGIRWVETDVNRLGDGTLVVFHDDHLGRLTPAGGRLAEVNWSTAKDLDVGSHFGAEFSDERMMTLRDTLALLHELNLGLNLEVKVYAHYRAEDVVPDIVAALEDEWHDWDRLIISSFNPQVLRLLKQARPQWPLGLLFEKIPDDWQSLAAEVQPVSVHCHYAWLRQPQVDAIKAQGLEIYCYTVNDRKAGIMLWDMGVDGVITDNPNLFAGL